MYSRLMVSWSPDVITFHSVKKVTLWEDKIYPRLHLERKLVMARAKSGLPKRLSGKESTCQYRKLGFDPWIEEIPWRRKQQPTPVFLSEKSHGQRSLVGYSPWGHKESDATELPNNNNSPLSCSIHARLPVSGDGNHIPGILFQCPVNGHVVRTNTKHVYPLSGFQLDFVLSRKESKATPSNKPKKQILFLTVIDSLASLFSHFWASTKY